MLFCSLRRHGGTIVVAGVVGPLRGGVRGCRGGRVVRRDGGQRQHGQQDGASKTLCAGSCPRQRRGQVSLFGASGEPSGRRPGGPGRAEGGAGSTRTARPCRGERSGGVKRRVGRPGPQGPQGTTGAGGRSIYPAFVDVNPLPGRSDSRTGLGRFLIATVVVERRLSHSDGSITDSVEWEVPLEAGTWISRSTHIEADEVGILTFSPSTALVHRNAVDGLTLVDRSAMRNSGGGRPEHRGGADSGFTTPRARTEDDERPSGTYLRLPVWLRSVEQ